MASDPPPAPREAYAAELLQIFEQRFGHELTERQAALLLRASASVFDQGDLALFRTLPADSSLVQAVVREVMNKESYFFRDPPTVDSLRRDVLPRLIEAASTSRVLRVWSAGCSTGEELYTLSILLHELIPDLESWSVVLVGTDIDARALAHAKVGRYKDWSLRTTSPEQRSQYFDYKPHLERYQLRPRYARAASFALHNLIDAHAPVPAPGCFDLILCRNVSIYFSRAAREVLARKLSSALAHNGCWIAGPSDPRPEVELEMRVLPGLIEYRKPPTGVQASRAITVRPASLPSPRVRAAAQRLPPPAPTVAPAREAKRAPAEQQLQHARALADRAEVEGALRIIDQLLRDDPLLADAYLLRALLVAPDDRRAIEDLRRVIYLDPASLEAYIHLGFGLERIGDRRGAIAAFRNAAALHAPEHSAASEELRRVAARRMTQLLAEDTHEES
ncbi:MAG TPA: CheR family methyltransferase [Polyangiales bacterium]|nr:CheR family methyltransferase [Polyangiales bacterium]